MSIKFNILKKGALVIALTRRNSRFKMRVREEFILAGDEFIEYIQDRWYTGRNSNDTGLRQRTRDLWRAWTSNVRDEGLDIVGVVSNIMDYARKHEFGEDGMPQRTFVREDMQEKGTQLYKDAVKKALRASF